MQIGIWTDHESVIEYGIQPLYEQREVAMIMNTLRY